MSKYCEIHDRMLNCDAVTIETFAFFPSPSIPASTNGATPALITVFTSRNKAILTVFFTVQEDNVGKSCNTTQDDWRGKAWPPRVQICSNVDGEQREHSTPAPISDRLADRWINFATRVEQLTLLQASCSVTSFANLFFWWTRSEIAKNDVSVQMAV